MTTRIIIQAELPSGFGASDDDMADAAAWVESKTELRNVTVWVEESFLADVAEAGFVSRVLEKAAAA